MSGVESAGAGIERGGLEDILSELGRDMASAVERVAKRVDSVLGRSR